VAVGKKPEPPLVVPGKKFSSTRGLKTPKTSFEGGNSKELRGNLAKKSLPTPKGFRSPVGECAPNLGALLKKKFKGWKRHLSGPPY